MDRLRLEALPSLPAHVKRPAYDISSVEAGVVHLGVGAFHRGHQALWFDDALCAGEQGWGIIGASLRSPTIRDQLQPQDWLYSVTERGPGSAPARIVGSLREVIVAMEMPERLLAVMSDPRIRIVTLTITEKGYHHDPATGLLREEDADIQQDLEHPGTPRTALGFLVEALRRRLAGGAEPFTILSCDNLPANGRTLRGLVMRMAELRDPALAAHIGAHVAFPCSMVDRIVPATTDADREEVAATLGVIDAAPVVTEPFSQWVIEDRFPGGRPRLERYGAQMVEDVAPFELMKLRLLNGSHSMMAYLGYLAGYQTIAETIADPAFRTFVATTMAEEIAPMLDVPEGVDLAAYQAQLLERFANPSLRHRTWQIAMDGSQKLPQRILDTIRERIAGDLPFHRLALGVAAWMRYVCGRDDAGRAIDVRDPLAMPLAAMTGAAMQEGETGEPGRVVAGLLSLSTVFGEDLPIDLAFRNDVTNWLNHLHRYGAKSAVQTANHR
jgi:fructuronate reductase